MYYFAACQQNSTAELPLFFLKLKTIVRESRLNETKPDTEDASNCSYFGFEVNKKSTFDEKSMFRVSL